MRIPRADEYFGNRITKRFPTVDPRVGVPESQDLSGIAAGEELKGIGEAVRGVWLGDVEAKKRDEDDLQRIRDQRQEEGQRELEEEERKREKADLDNKVIFYKGGLVDIAKNIVDSPEYDTMDKQWSEFEAKAGEFKSEFLKDVSEDKKYIFEPHHSEVSWEIKNNLYKFNKERLKEQTFDLIGRSREELERQAALNSKDRLVAIVKYEKILEGSDIPEKTRNELLQEFKENTAKTQVTNAFNDIDISSPYKALEQTRNLTKYLNEKDDQGNYKFLPDMDPDDRAGSIRTLKIKEEAYKTDIEQEKKRLATEVKNDFELNLKYYGDILEKGLTIDSNWISRMHTTALKLGGDEPLRLGVLEEKYGPVYRMQQKAKNPLFGTGFKGITLETMAQAVNNPEILDPIIETSKQIQKKQGLNYAPLWNPDYIDPFVDVIKQAPDVSFKTLEFLQAKLGPSGKNSILKFADQVAQKDSLVGTAIAYLTDGDRETAKKIISGSRIMKESKDIAMPDEKAFRQKFNEYTKDISNYNLSSLSAAYESWKAVYAYEAGKKNKRDGLLDETIASDTLANIVGEVVKVNGKNTLIPTGLTEDKFNNMLRSVNGELIRKQGMAGNITKGGYLLTSDDMSEEIRNHAKLHEVGDGIYRIEIDGQILRSGTTGQYLELNFSRDGVLMKLSTERAEIIDQLIKEKKEIESKDRYYETWKDVYRLP